MCVCVVELTRTIKHFCAQEALPRFYSFVLFVPLAFSPSHTHPPAHRSPTANPPHVPSLNPLINAYSYPPLSFPINPTYPSCLLVLHFVSQIEACFAPGSPADQLLPPDQDSYAGGASMGGSANWQVLLPRTRLSSDAIHNFSADDGGAMRRLGPISHVRLTIYPDGGVMRLRVKGRRAPDSRL